jgi:hypothetical protein
LELLDPILSESLHFGGGGQAASDHPWATSPVLGDLDRIDNRLTLHPGRLYTVRVSGLAPHVIQVLDAAFDPDTPLGREPLILNRFEFNPVPKHIRWHGLRTDASILTNARPQSSISVRFMSPTAFKTKREQGIVPSFRLCVEGWLRRWNALSPVEIPEGDIQAFAEDYASVTESHLRPASVQFGSYALTGVTGTVMWEISENPSILSRLVGIQRIWDRKLMEIRC